MTVDNAAAKLHTAPELRVLSLHDIDLDGFLVAAEEAQSVAALTAVFMSRVRGAGFTRAHYVQVIGNFERVPLSKGDRLLENDGKQTVPPTRLSYFDPDEAITRKLARLQPYTWVELAGKYELNAELQGRIDEYRAAGFFDGVTVPVALREGDVAAFALLQPNVIFSISPAAMRKLQYFCHAMHARHYALDPAQSTSMLSKRETQVMTQVAVGKTNAEIAAILGISVHTVNTLVRRCFVKLGVSNRVEAAARTAYLMRRG